MTQGKDMPTQAELTSKFAIQMQEFGFSRRMGVSSPVLFQSCFNRVPWGQVTLVRRKVGGLAASNSGNFDGSANIASFPYLRMDFFEVLLTAVSWDGGGDEEVKEKYKFVCRKVKVQYRQQEHHGKLKAPVGGDMLSLVQSS